MTAIDSSVKSITQDSFSKETEKEIDRLKENITIVADIETHFIEKRCKEQKLQIKYRASFIQESIEEMRSNNISFEKIEAFANKEINNLNDLGNKFACRNDENQSKMNESIASRKLLLLFDPLLDAVR